MKLTLIIVNMIIGILFLCSMYFDNIYTTRILHFGFWVIYVLTLIGAFVNDDMHDLKAAPALFQKQYPMFTRVTIILGQFWLILLILNGWWVLGSLGIVVQIIQSGIRKEINK